MAADKAASQRGSESLTGYGQCADERPPACGLPDDNARALTKWPPACGLPLDNAEIPDLIRLPYVLSLVAQTSFLVMACLSPPGWFEVEVIDLT